MEIMKSPGTGVVRLLSEEEIELQLECFQCGQIWESPGGFEYYVTGLWTPPFLEFLELTRTDGSGRRIRKHADTVKGWRLIVDNA